MRTLSNVIGFDDAPFDHDHRGDVPVVGAVFARLRFDGVVIGKVRKDGANATRSLCRLIQGSKFSNHLQLILLQGIALAGFNVVDVPGLHRATGLPVLVVCRRRPNLAAMRRALLSRVHGGRRKWALVERLGGVEPAGDVYVQRAGLSGEQALRVVRALAANSRVPEPLRVAHLIAGALVGGQSRGRV